MAKNIKLTSGSIFNGNPITFSVEPMVVTGKDGNGKTIYPSFHRAIFEINCGLNNNGVGNYETIKLSSPIEQEKEGLIVEIDISSALRVFRDSYDYMPEAVKYPFVSFNIKAYDEYMLNGEVRTNMEAIYFPGETAYLRTLFGAFSDYERLKAGVSKDVICLSRKPTSSPQIVAVGETYAYTLPYSSYQSLANSGELKPPTSFISTVIKEGHQSIGGQHLYAIPQNISGDRNTFRFINSFGVLESISVPRAYSKKLSVSSTAYVIARQETFNTFSRSAISKKNNRESWLFMTDPLDENWLHWYLHEFLMSEHIWIEIGDIFVPCTVTPEEETVVFDKTNANLHSVSFTAQLDINGSTVL